MSVLNIPTPIPTPSNTPPLFDLESPEAYVDQASNGLDPYPRGIGVYSTKQTIINKITSRSLAKCGITEEAMVYGFEHCYYKNIGKVLENRCQVRLYDCQLGDDICFLNPPGVSFLRKNGDRLHQISSGAASATKKSKDQVTRRVCKTALVNLVLENFQRSKEGNPLVPIVFCIDKDNNEYELTSEALLSKAYRTRPHGARALKSTITVSELRRAYKLCTDPRVDPIIREIAKKTLIFVKVTVVERTLPKVGTHLAYDLVTIAAPWENNPVFDQELLIRQAESAKKTTPRKAYDWRAQVNEFVGRSKLKEVEVADDKSTFCSSCVVC